MNEEQIFVAASVKGSAAVSAGGAALSSPQETTNEHRIITERNMIPAFTAALPDNAFNIMITSPYRPNSAINLSIAEFILSVFFAAADERSVLSF